MLKHRRGLSRYDVEASKCMVDILTQHQINGKTPDELRERLAQLSDPANFTAEFERLLEAALRADVATKSTQASDAQRRAQQRQLLQRKINIELHDERDAITMQLEMSDFYERLAAFRYSSPVPLIEIDHEELRAALEQSAGADVQEPTTTKPKPTEAEKLLRDQQQHEATGEVTTRLLCDIHGIKRGALGQYLRNLHAPKNADGNKVAPIISTSEPRKFTEKDRGEVAKRLTAGAVKRRPKQPDK